MAARPANRTRTPGMVFRVPHPPGLCGSRDPRNPRRRPAPEWSSRPPWRRAAPRSSGGAGTRSSARGRRRASQPPPNGSVWRSPDLPSPGAAGVKRLSHDVFIVVLLWCFIRSSCCDLGWTEQCRHRGRAGPTGCRGPARSSAPLAPVASAGREVVQHPVTPMSRSCGTWCRPGTGATRRESGPGRRSHRQPAPRNAA